jgi:hypothetical protein
LKSEFFTLFANLAAVTSIDPEKLQDQAKVFGEPINIKEVLAGDTKVLLYVRNIIDYNDSIPGLKRFSETQKQHDAFVQALITANMD